MSGIGPVEPEDSADGGPWPPSPHSPHPYLQQEEGAPPALRDDCLQGHREDRRIRLRLPRRGHEDRPARFRPRALAVVLAATAALAVALWPTHPGPPHPHPSPGPPLPPRWPAQTVSLQYVGLDEPIAPYKASAVFAFVLTTDAQHDDSVTVDQLAQAFPEIGTSTTPPVPFTVPAGGTVRVVVRLTARSCSGFPLDPELPYLDTTLTNNYATQQHSYLFDGRYARDLSRYLHTICPSTPLTRTAVVSPIVTH